MKKVLLSLVTSFFVWGMFIGFTPAGGEAASHKEISTQELKAKFDKGEDFLLVDVLPQIMFNEQHIKGSINIPIGQIEKSDEGLPKDKNRLIIFYCMGRECIYSPQAADLAIGYGYTNVMVYLEGIPGWAKAGYPMASTDNYPKISIPLISPKDLQKISASSCTILDIRPASSFDIGHIKGSLNIEMETLHLEVGSLPKDKKIVLIDHKGKTTLTAGRFLTSKGFQDIVRLDGGFYAWAADKLPVEK